VREICFLTATRGNAFMTEILRAVADAVAAEGVAVSLRADRYPAFEDDVVHVVIPHEFFDLAPDGGAPSPGHLHRTVGYCVELPGTQWFHATAQYGKQLGGLVDIRRSGVAALASQGLAAVHAPLGYTPAWDAWHGDETAPRPLDVLYLGSRDARRDAVLATYADTLRHRRSRMVIAPPEAKPEAGPSFLIGGDRDALLRSAKTLLNVHRTGAEALEWPRVLQAICNGCVVVTERSLDAAPLVAGEHLVAGRAESLALLADALLEEPDRVAAMRRAAYDFVRSELPMADGARRLIEVAERVARRPLRQAGSAGLDQGWRGPPAEDPDPALARVRVALKRLLVEVGEQRRELAALQDGHAKGRRGPAVRVVAATPAYEAATPRVTVGVSLHDYETEIRDALAGVAASEYPDYEVVVLDDASADASAAAARAFLEQHPWMPAVLLEHSHNGGLGRTRNAINQRARGELVFVLDADNGPYPHALGRLVRALDDDPEARFAYPIVAVHENGSPTALLSPYAWDPALLRDDNPIDAMALLRREAVLEIGGYAEDPRLVGWEDYDLWCRMAQRGWHGVHVPEILCWYRRSRHSMLATTGVDLSEARSLLASRAPGVFAEAPL
jgi:glycosyl transferase family 2/glycosyl transferase family 1